VSRDRIGIIRSLILDSKFNVYIFTTSSTEDSIYNIAINSLHFKNKILLPINIRESREIIKNLKLNILVYPEIGMDPFFYLLAFSRLAPIQINTWGHSETSGIDSIDYYFSSKYYEVENLEIAQQNYSEKLICLHSLCTFYYSLRIYNFFPELKSNLKEINKYRIHFNLPKNATIYGIFQTTFKYHPHMLKIIKHILYLDPKAIIVMLTYTNLEERFLDYLDSHLGYHSSRVRVFSRIIPFEFYKLIISMNIIVDSYPFGGCNGSLEAFNLGKVVITLPSDKINGRFTFGFYNKMNIHEPICSNLKDVAEKSVFYANNSVELNKLENKILQNLNKIFEEEESIVTWKQMLTQLHNYNIR